MTASRPSSVARLPLAAAVLCALGLLTALMPSGAQADVVQAPAAQARPAGPAGSDDIDVLTASRDEVRTELDDIERRYGDQRGRVEQARQASRDAEAASSDARARVATAKVELEAARATVAEYAVEAYMRPPAADSLRVLSLSSAEDAGFAHSVMEIMTEDRQQVVDELVLREEAVAREQQAADAAAEEARRRSSDAEVQLVELDRVRSEQADLVDSMDERLAAALAEAAALAAIDQVAAEQLAAEEVALRNSGPTSTARSAPIGDVSAIAMPLDRPSPTGGAGPPATSAPSGGAGPAPTAPPVAARPPAPRPPTTAPARPPTSGVTWSDVVNVGGIWVHGSIANNVRDLLNAATSAGLSLRGGGYRDPAGQIATRRNNCGPTYYDIYEKPSGQCSPPTARPGRSMHERGLAIDFTSSGRLITSRSDPAFTWLRANASRYGLYNLPSEPWHWSTTGN